MRNLLLALAALSCAAPSSAEVFLGQTTLADPVYNRVLSGIPPSGYSAVGTAVHYAVLPFSVTVTGGYDFLLSGDTPAGWDTFLTIYNMSFDPTSGLSNAFAANDDFPSIGLSGFSGLNLSSGTSYFAVIGGFENADFGTYTLSVTGPGAVVQQGAAVPEPASWAMMIGGLAVAGAAMRRRKVAVRFA